MLRVSVTTLEKFRRYMTEATCYDTEAALLETIRGEFVGNDKTRIGGAFHKIIEDGAPTPTWINEKPGYLIDDIFLHLHQGDHAAVYRQEHPLMIFEVPINHVYTTSYGDIAVTGRVDSIEGAEVWDPKTRYRSVDFEEYIDSYQWRYYLDALNLDAFHYQLFEFKGFDKFNEGPPFIVPEDVTVVTHEHLRITRYINLHQDCLSLLEEFLGYVENRNIFHLLKTFKQESYA